MWRTTAGHSSTPRSPRPTPAYHEHDNDGDVVERQTVNQPCRSAAVLIGARKPAGDTQRKQSAPAHSRHYQRCRRIERRAEKKRSRYRRDAQQRENPLLFRGRPSRPAGVSSPLATGKPACHRRCDTSSSRCSREPSDFQLRKPPSRLIGWRDREVVSRHVVRTHCVDALVRKDCMKNRASIIGIVFVVSGVLGAASCSKPQRNECDVRNR